MFTGLVTHQGIVAGVTAHAGGRRLVIVCAQLRERETPGASIAVNGACLTVVELRGDNLAFDIVPETLARTNLGALAQGERVNLEPSLRLGDPLGGHLVYGHIDATCTMRKKAAQGLGMHAWCSIPQALGPMIVEKGFVALDGVSLTVAEVTEDRSEFAVALIPETLARTTFGTKGDGATLNLEVDPIARYVKALLGESSECR